jgi:hypothetical protein
MGQTHTAGAHGHQVDQKIENPGVLKASSTLTAVFSVLVALGLVSFFMTVGSDPSHAWTAFLRAHFYFMALSVMGLFFTAIHWVTSSMWSTPIRRLAEGLTAYLPIALITTLLVILGASSLFQWMHPEHFKGDLVIEGKLGYLNITFFSIRAIVGVAGWMWFARKMVGSSVAADSIHDNGANFKRIYESNRKWSVGFLIFFALSYSAIAFDQLMSLDPHFFSTMFGVYVFAGAFQTLFAALTLLAIIMRRSGYLKQVINDNHYHDLGKYMFAFTVFWAYIGFSQYMLIWYANLPEETGYFLLRFNEGWEFWTIALFIGKFFVPFFLLLPRGNKRSETVLLVSGIWIMIAQYFDLNWMIQPQVYPNGPVFGFADIGVFLGFFGVFGLSYMHFFKKRNLLAITDPTLPQSAFHHHVQ